MKKLIIFMLVSMFGAAMAAQTEFRPPSVPLVVNTPYFSVWSPGDWLTDTNTASWTGTPQPLDNLIRIDGRAYRLMGVEPANVPALKQISIQVLPTRTIAVFTNETVQVTMTFMTPGLLNDLDVLSRPVTYLTWQVRSIDGKPHQVQLYFGASTLLAVNHPDEPVTWNDVSSSGLKILRAGTQAQSVLQTYGDEIRIDWGYFYLAGPADDVNEAGFGSESTAPESFAHGENLPTAQLNPPEAPDGDAPVLAMTLDLGKVGAEPIRRHVMLAYDEVKAIRYFTTDLEPYWKRNGMTAPEMLEEAELDYSVLVIRCGKFDDELMRDMKQAGGDKYVTLGALAYRQTIGMHDLVADSGGNQLLFSKEPSSSGNIDTVDVIYPSSPLFLLFNPGLLRAMLVPILDYCNGPIIKHDSCPHDLGIYPRATGCWNGDGEIEIMPVEETADMLIMLAAVAHIEGNADLANQYWPLLTRWVGYLKRKGWDLDLQLCTDDFTGHLARNVNLSMKSILAMGAYAELAGMLGKTEEAAKWRETASEFAANLLKAADDGDHTMLALGHPGTWSQKYNLVWDKVLGLKLFPDEVRRREVAWYKKVMNPYGVPLDSRATFTKLDWSVWSASLTGNRQDFETLIDPIYRLLDESPQRVPMGDLLETTTPKWRAFKARPVVGGVFIQMLYNQALWKKWARRAPVIPNVWAPFPMKVPPDTVLEDSQLRPREWYYTTHSPGTNWTHVELDYKVWIGRHPGWRSTRGGFGSVVDESAGIRTHWDGSELWLRKPFVIWERDIKNLTLHVCHAGPVEIYFNEVLAAKLTGSSHGKFEAVAVNPNATAVLQPTDTLNTLAVHCGRAETAPMFDLGITCEK
ncbi:MAG TPA: DUF5127 domain-containing protein [Verrucomicrobiae bacterium]|nr:DUF5127 domain-containing protein [Verrucomicrobiae bacterium]